MPPHALQVAEPHAAGVDVRAAAHSRPDVEVRTSTRRRKTVAAYWEGDHIVVVVPAHLRGRALATTVDELTRRVERHRPNLTLGDEALHARAVALGHAYLDDIRPASITWSSRQQKRWGSCDPAERTIRISERLRPVPGWVLDAVIVHELAHLLDASHSARFKGLVNRYPRSADASVFLEGYALGCARAADNPREPDDA